MKKYTLDPDWSEAVGPFSITTLVQIQDVVIVI